MRKLIVAGLCCSLFVPALLCAPGAGAEPGVDDVRVAFLGAEPIVDAEITSGDLHVTDNRFGGRVERARGEVQADGLVVDFDVAAIPVLEWAHGSIRIADADGTAVERLSVYGRIIEHGPHHISGRAFAVDVSGFFPRLRLATWEVRDANPGPGDHVMRVAHGGRPRTFIVHAPPGYDAATPAPVVVMLHGAGSPTAWAQELFQDMTSQADESGFILVLPAGVNAVWNSGGGPGADPGFDGGVDDVGFLDAMLDEIEAYFGVDAGRVYVAGFSNGGGMAHRLACQRAGRYAAFAALHITKQTTYPCDPERPVAVMMMAGTADPVVGYGESGPTRLDMEGTVGFWRDENGCAVDPVVSEIADANPFDATTVTHREYAGCADGGAVEFYVINGGGHNWPGAPPFLPSFILGKNNLDIDANERVWNFVSQFTLAD